MCVSTVLLLDGGLAGLAGLVGWRDGYVAGVDQIGAIRTRGLVIRSSHLHIFYSGV